MRDPAGNIKWRCKFCATERIGQLSIAAQVTGIKFGFLQVKPCPTAKALAPLAIKMTSSFSGQGAVERYHKSVGLHRDRYSNLKQLETAMCQCVRNQSVTDRFSRGTRNQSLCQNEMFSKSLRMPLTRCVLLVLKEKRLPLLFSCSSARAAAAADDNEDDLDSVDADKDAE